MISYGVSHLIPDPKQQLQTKIYSKKLQLSKIHLHTMKTENISQNKTYTTADNS